MGMVGYIDLTIGAGAGDSVVTVNSAATHHSLYTLNTAIMSPI